MMNVISGGLISSTRFKMAVVCPTITGTKTEDEFKSQLEVVAPFSHRIQIDLADGVFSSPKTLEPERTWWPDGVKADFHIMYKNPAPAVDELLNMHPNLIIVHFETGGNFQLLSEACHKTGIKFGLALLPNSRAEPLVKLLPNLDHVLIFSGVLGSFGGHANLDLLSKAHILKQHKQDLEIGWDGGVNAQNASQLVFGGVDVLNVGGYIQNADDPEKAFSGLKRIADETGTT